MGKLGLDNLLQTKPLVAEQFISAARGSYGEIPEATKIYNKLAGEFKFDHEKAREKCFEGATTEIVFKDGKIFYPSVELPRVEEPVRVLKEYLERASRTYSSPKSWKVEGVCGDFADELVKRLKRSGLYARRISMDREAIKREGYSIWLGHAGVIVAERDKGGHTKNVAVYEAMHMDGKAPGFVQLKKLEGGIASLCTFSIRESR